MTAEDAEGNIATNYAGSVSLALAGDPAGGTLGGTTTVSATQGGKQQSHSKVTFRGGKTKQVKLRLKAKAIAAMVRHHRAVAVKITASTGSYRTSKTLR